MKATRNTLNKLFPGILLLVGLWSAWAVPVHAQDAAVRRQIRTYIPPDQLVSFLPSTPFNVFVEYLNPIFQRVTGKEVIDAETRSVPIGIAISGMHFLDALELVLNYNSLQYRETDRYFLVEQMPAEMVIRSGDQAAGIESAVTPGTVLAPANLHTKQIRINAILFELNHTKAKDTGINWSVLLGEAGGQGAQQQQGGAQGQENSVSFFLKTNKLIPDNDLISAPNQIDFSDLNSLIRLAEVNGVGETVANPSVTVQSGIQGRIQIGQDVPVQTQDFAGNTQTEFFKTGVIINVTPTLITEPVADTLGAPTLDFVHITADVEKSSSRPTVSGPVIDRSQANTQVLLLDGEQTVIGGLYSTEQSVSRTGIPLLKDLPPWFFGLRYLFGRSSESITQKELIIVLQAEVIEPLLTRAGKPFRTNLLEARREAVRQALERFNADVAGKVADPKTFKGTKEK